MKTGREIRYEGVETIDEAILLLLRVRFAECLELEPALLTEDDEAMHAFRLACKRLRFAIERFEKQLPELTPVAEFLSHVTDELGSAHDCVVLAQRSLTCEAPLIALRARRDRDRYVAHARRVWRRAFRKRGAMGALAQYAGFRWELP